MRQLNMVCPHNAGSMLKPSTPKTLGDVTNERIGFIRMDSIPENLAQCAFNFESLSTQPIEDIPTPISQTVTQKQCTKCKQFFPATKQFFFSHKRQRDGLNTQCKSCVTISNKKNKEKPRIAIPEGYKQCSKCKETKAATNEFFNNDKTRRDGLYPQCRQCTARPPRPSDVPEGHKRCPVCKNIYPLTKEFFYPSKVQKIRFDYQCKECQHKRGKEYSMRNGVRGRRLVRQKTWNDEHKEEHKEYYKVYNEVNKEVVSRRAKRYRQEHKEAISDRGKRYYHANKASFQARDRAYRARKRGIAGTHTPAQITEQLKRQRYRCYYAACGHAKFKKIKGKHVFHVEHTYPLSRVAGSAIPANSMDYLVLACPTCNISKGNKFPWEWVEGGRLV